MKSTKPQTKYKERRETNEFLQRDKKKRLQEISLKAHKEQTLISTIFSNLTNEQDTQLFSLTKVFTNVSQPKKTSQTNSNQRPTTLKLPPLIFQVSLS